MIGGGFQNIFKIPELKKRILFTLAILIVYRIGVHVPVPGIDSVALASFFKAAEGTIFGIFNMFSGGAFEKLSVFALGIMPYISASIILQLLTVVIPHLEQLKKEGEQGRKKITQYTRYGTVVLSVIQGFGTQQIAGGENAWDQEPQSIPAQVTGQPGRDGQRQPQHDQRPAFGLAGQALAVLPISQVWAQMALIQQPLMKAGGATGKAPRGQ